MQRDNPNIKISSSLEAGVFDSLDEISSVLSTTRHASARKAFEAIFGDDIKIWFDDAIIFAEIPKSYYKACKEQSIEDNQVIPFILEKGKRQLLPA